ncbi:alpha-amylase family glycosyl hydrolase [Deinococcus malanensis]|uniref:alpha-amylase family glycosyl hydrolase n=1 Tax=Deinococcus malanensis TaxID=1706855 RepID=UPI003626D43F
MGHLRDLGITAIELLPLSAFPGQRGWGYDGVAHFAPFAPYGPPEDLQAFIDEAHGHGLLVLLDMVYNHFGPDGNYLGAYSPSISRRHIRRRGARLLITPSPLCVSWPSTRQSTGCAPTVLMASGWTPPTKSWTPASSTSSRN